MEYGKMKIDQESDTVSLKELIIAIKSWLTYLFSKKIIIITFIVVGFVLGYIYAYFKVPMYTATTTFVLEEGDSGGGMSNFGGLASMVGIDVGGGGGLFQGDNIIELYKSRTMIQKALLSRSSIEPNILLIDWFIEFNHLKDEWKSVDWKRVDFKRSNGSIVQDSILREIVKSINKNYLSVSKPDKKLAKIQVDVKSENEFFSKEFSQQIVNAVNSFYIQTKTKRSAKNISILQHKVDSVRSVMNGSIYAAVAVSDATPNLNPTRQIQRTAPSQKAQFSAEANKGVLSEMLKNLEITKMSLLKETPLIQVIDSPILPLEKISVGKIKSALLGSLLLSGIIIMILSVKLVFKNILS